MTNSLQVPSKKAGLPPGTLVHIGRLPPQIARISLMAYGPDRITEHTVHSIDDIFCSRPGCTTTWVHCEGLALTEMLEEIGHRLQVHPLVLEDILNTHQRPKFEEFDHYLFVVLKTLRHSPQMIMEDEQISFLQFSNLLITFRERQDDLFHSLRQRLQNGKGRLRTMGTDYLAYAIMDTVVDNYFTVSDTLEEGIEATEVLLLTTPASQTFATIQRLKKELVHIRKAITPLREVLLAIERCDSDLIEERTRPFLRDVLDHVLRVIDTTDSHRDLINGMLDIYHSSLSNRMNEIMKVLTVFATIFIPLTFIAGIYGMNFDYMPELHWKWSYPAVWSIFIALPALLLWYFRKKKWL